MSQETEQFRIIVKTYKGLEDVLVQELEALGASDITPLKRAVECSGDLRMLYTINLRCRTALKVLRPFHTFKAENADEVYEEVKKYDWDSLLTVKDTIAIQSTVFSDNFSHSKFVTYRVKDAIVDWFNEKYEQRPSVRVTNPDFQFNLHISGTSCTLSQDSSGESLHKRGWRKEQTEAPLSEVLAAGLILKTGWKGESDLYDPMCGSGTFLIEAAMIACNIAPGIYRQNFGFEKWSDFDQDLFSELYDDDSEEREFKHKIYGSDVSPDAIAIAETNIKSAGLSKRIVLEQISFQRQKPKGTDGGILITNPPYGERLKVNDMKDLYSIIGERLKHAFAGFSAWILGYQEESFFAIGLRPSQKIEIKNGDLDCQYRHYELYDGSKKTSKQGPEDEERRERKKAFDRDDKRTDYEKRLEFRRKNNPDEQDKRSEFKKRRDDDERPDFKRRDRAANPDDRREFKGKDERGERRDFKRERSNEGRDRKDTRRSEGDDRRDVKRERSGERRDFKGRERGGREEGADFKRKPRFGDKDNKGGFKRSDRSDRKPFERKFDDKKSFDRKGADDESRERKTYEGDDKWDRPEFRRKGRPGEAERRAEWDRRRSGGRLGGSDDKGKK